MKLKLLFLAFIVCVASASPAAAHLFYTIDIDSDELVVITAETGAIVSLGPLGFDFFNVDLTVVGSTLYALNSAFNQPGGTGDVTLVIIDPTVPAILSTHPVTVGGQPVLHAEGLAADPFGQLFALVSWLSPDFPKSNTMGELALTGALTNVLAYDSFATSGEADGDGMACSQAGDFLWTDSTPTSRSLIQIGVAPQSYAVLGTHAADATNDLAWTCGGESLWSIDRVSLSMSELNPANGAVIQTVSYASTHFLFGLAPMCGAVPVEDSTWGKIKQEFK